MNPLEQPACVTGIGGHGINLLHKGMLAEFNIKCFAEYKPVANTLCYADVAENFAIIETADKFNE